MKVSPTAPRSTLFLDASFLDLRENCSDACQVGGLIELNERCRGLKRLLARDCVYGQPPAIIVIIETIGKEK